MTRSRFVKLLMSQGNSRNDSMKIALCYNNRNFSYKNAYSDYLVKYALTNAFGKLGQSASKFGISIVELSNAFAKFQTALKEVEIWQM